MWYAINTELVFGDLYNHFYIETTSLRFDL